MRVRRASNYLGVFFIPSEQVEGEQVLVSGCSSDDGGGGDRHEKSGTPVPCYFTGFLHIIKLLVSALATSKS
jgi:hypothetical protein